MQSSAIAIIGVAGRFPDATDVEQFYDNLRQGRQSARAISRERLDATTLDPNGRYRIMGYLEDVDRFDHAFFGIPLGEARLLSPNVRLLLEEAWHAFESSGWPPEQFRGTRTDVYMTQTDSVYAEFAEEQSSALFTGNSPDFMVARLSRQFDLRGNAAIVDTSCSSGLSALMMACDALRLDRADYALVCGTNLQLFPYDRPSLLDTWSADGECRSYSSDANGMVAGEVAVCLLLCRLADARSRRHVVHAVIRGGALNNNGAASSSPSAPHSVAQAHAMTQAWREAGVAAHELGFIEGHGSATQLGDSLEIEALRLAFKGHRGAGPCGLSSVKANIGHGKSAAALSSVVKTVLSVQRGVFFPAPQCRQLNTVLRKPDSPVVVNTELLAWPAERRLAGVHSVGMSGVNCHVVIENHRDGADAAGGDAPEWFPVPVSARTRAGLFANAQALRRSIASRDVSSREVAHTLSLGRQHFEHRRSAMARDKDELIRRWDEWLAAPDGSRGDEGRRVPRIVMLFSADPDPADQWNVLSRQLTARFPCVRRTRERFGRREADDPALRVIVPIALRELLAEMGISGALAGIGVGKLAIAALAGTMAEDRAIAEASTMPDAPVPDLEARMARLIAQQGAQGPVVFLQMGRESAVSRQARRAIEPSTMRVEALEEDAVRSLGDIVGRLFADGWPLQFAPWFEERSTRPVQLPGYQFAATRCWIRSTVIRPAAQPMQGEESGVPREDERRWLDAPHVERKLAEIWRELLGHARFGRDDSVFEAGADSLLATRIVRRINEEFRVRCDFEDIFDRPTLAGLARLVRDQCSLADLVASIWKDVLKIDTLGPHDDFFELGGHSLLASEILLRVRGEFNVVLSFDDFFGVPTLTDFTTILQDRLHASVESHAPTAPKVTAPEPLPLTPAAWAATLQRRETQ